MERDEEGRYVLTEAEADTARAALFVAVHHRDDVVGHCDSCFQTIAGVDASALPALMHEFDERNGHNARVDAHLSAEIEKLAAKDDAALTASGHLSHLLSSARKRGLPIPERFSDRG